MMIANMIRTIAVILICNSPLISEFARLGEKDLGEDWGGGKRELGKADDEAQGLELMLSRLLPMIGSTFDDINMWYTSTCL